MGSLKKRAKPRQQGERNISIDEAGTAVCRWYGYKLEDIYQKRFCNGGLTQWQIITLYNHELNRQIEAQGGSVDQGQTLSANNTPNTQQAKQKQSANAVPLFGAPEDYAHMSEEEKEKLTQEMMAKHKDWVEKKKPTGGKGCQAH